MVLVIGLFLFPAVMVGEEYLALGIDLSPNIIIAGKRNGEFRIFTDMRYSSFIGKVTNQNNYLGQHTKPDITRISLTSSSRRC